jgi:preprotein translocase subunit SecD
MQTLKSRVLVIVALVAMSGWALFPRTEVVRVKRDGVFVLDTVKRVPLKRGLDLQGGCTSPSRWTSRSRPSPT